MCLQEPCNKHGEVDKRKPTLFWVRLFKYVPHFTDWLTIGTNCRRYLTLTNGKDIVLEMGDQRS